VIPRGDERRDALPFLTPHAASLAGAVRRGEPRRIHSRKPRVRFIPTFARVSRPRYRLERATPDGLPRRSHSWRLICTGPRTERRTCRRPGREMVRASCVRCMRGDARMRTAFPSSAISGRPMSSVGPLAGEEPRYQPTNRSRPAFRREPAKDHVIQQTGTPSTVANAGGRDRVDRSTLPCSASVSRSRRPHPFRRGANAFVRALQAPRSRSPAIHGFERRAPL
jgi:hypothetical protein